MTSFFQPCKFDSMSVLNVRKKLAQSSQSSQVISLTIINLKRDITSLTLQWNFPSLTSDCSHPRLKSNTRKPTIMNYAISDVSSCAAWHRFKSSQAYRSSGSITTRKTTPTTCLFEILHKPPAHINEEVSHRPSNQKLIHKYIEPTICKQLDSRPPSCTRF